MILNIKNVRDDQFEYKIETPIELQYIFKLLFVLF